MKRIFVFLFFILGLILIQTSWSQWVNAGQNVPLTAARKAARLTVSQPPVSKKIQFYNQEQRFKVDPNIFKLKSDFRLNTGIVLWGNERGASCPRFYDLIENGRGGNCEGILRPGAVSFDGHAITGGYECRFNRADFQQWLITTNTSCSGEIHICSEEGYYCISTREETNGTCPPGYRLDHSWTGRPALDSRWPACDVSTGGRQDISWCSGFLCMKDPPSDDFNDGIPSHVCQAEGAMLLGGSCGENCCVFLED